MVTEVVPSFDQSRRVQRFEASKGAFALRASTRRTPRNAR